VVNEGGMARVVHGVGSVRFQLEYGGLLELDGVLFVPGLRVNLLSVSALEDVGYNDIAYCSKGNMSLSTGREWTQWSCSRSVTGWTGCIC
jgi:hypothetical protein